VLEYVSITKENQPVLIAKVGPFVRMIKKRDIVKYVMGLECVDLIGVKLQ
jgi:hypothetical protein